MPRGQRYDAYGKPLAALTEARQASLVDHVMNQRQRQRLHRLLEEALEEALLPLLHRGRYAELTLRCTIKDGILVAEISTQVSRVHRPEEEE